jgi:protein-arginine kinase activator protein McsA
MRRVTNKWLKFTMFLVLVSCAQVTSLNLKKHQFGQLPTKIIWIQVAGFNDEHLALLKYSYPSSDTRTSFENFLCVGKAWEYNLFQLRPSAQASFMSQITGKKKIRSKCDDYQLKPIWAYMLENGYKAGVFEGEMSLKESLLQANNCKNNKFLKDITLWKMSKKTKKDQGELFHLSEKKGFKNNKIYFDRSCSTGECFSTFARNIESVYGTFSKNNDNHLFLIRNTSFQKALVGNKISRAKEELGQINQVISYFHKLAEKRNDMLVLLTSAAPRGVEFPRSGKQWERFENKRNTKIDKRTKLIASVMASGARAENFCGIYEQSQIMSRIFSGAKQQGLELAIINPFK